MKLTPLFIITILIVSLLNFTPTAYAVPAEQLLNIGFENVSDWILNLATYDGTVAHSGVWALLLQTSMGYVEQTLATPVDSDGITALGLWTYWIGGNNPTLDYQIHYNDTTDSSYNLWLGADTPNTWTYHNTITGVTAGKFVEKIKVWSYVDDTPTVYLDDFSLLWESPVAVPVSVVITDMDTVNNLYSMRKYYSFECVVSSLTNPCDVETVTLTCKQGGVVLFEVEAITLTTVPQWTITVGAGIIDLDSANCLWSVVGGTGTATFKIRTEWDFPDDSDLDLYLTAENISGASAETVMQTDYFDVISSLIATMNTGTPTVPLNFAVGITGLVTYPNTVGGLVSSGFYPPNAQFTSVALYEDATLIVTDNGVINGAYDVVFTPALILMSHTYHLHLNMVADFISGHPQNNPTLIIKVSNDIISNWAGIVWWLDLIFSLFGVLPDSGGIGPTAWVVTWITTMSSFFIQSVTLMISTVQMLGSIIIGGGGFLLTWGGNVATIVIQVTGIVKGILDGTGYTINGVLYVFPNGIGNVWSTLGGATTMSLIPVLIIVFWMQSLDGRVLTTGQNHISLAIGDIQTAFGIISIFMWFSMLVYGTIFGIVQWVFGLIGGIFTK